MPDYTHAVYTSVKNTWQDAENLDDEHGYVTYIWIPEETYKVDIMKLHVYSEKFRAYSKTVAAGGGKVITSGGGGAAVKTSSGGGAHSHDVTATTSSASDTASFGGIIDEYTGMWAHTGSGITTGGPSDTNDAHIPTFGNCPLGHSLCAVTGSYHVYSGSQTHTHEIPALTPVLGPTVIIWDDWSAKSHKHTVSGQTAEAVGTHTHTVTLTDHTHSVTIPDHTHDISFGIYEEDITSRTLSAILYDPDGNELEDFGVVLTGEDSDIIDLTDHFETLQYGMYKMVLTAS